jgi:hypothetical protein
VTAIPDARALPAARTRAPHNPARSREAAVAFLFLAPFLLIYAVFLIYPLFKGMWISTRDWDLMGGDYGSYGTPELPRPVGRSHLLARGAQHHGVHGRDGAPDDGPVAPPRARRVGRRAAARRAALRFFLSSVFS